MAGDANTVEQCPILRSITRSFAASPATIRKKIWLRFVLHATPLCIAFELWMWLMTAIALLTAVSWGSLCNRDDRRACALEHGTDQEVREKAAPARILLSPAVYHRTPG